MESAFNDTLLIETVDIADAGKYRVSVSNEAGEVKSDEAEVVVNEPIIIVQQPIQSRVIEGENAVFKVNATGTELIEYEWRFNGKILEDEFSAELVVHDVNKENEGVYQVVLKNPAGSKVSNEAKLTVVQPAVISGQPEGAVKLLGQAYEISVIASGSKPFRYQWYKNGQALDLSLIHI